jgi:hypothetical protein
MFRRGVLAQLRTTLPQVAVVAVQAVAVRQVQVVSQAQVGMAITQQRLVRVVAVATQLLLAVMVRLAKCG